MLDLLRQNTNSFGIYLLFSIIIVVFIFTFNSLSPSQACGGAPNGLTGDMGSVGGTHIDRLMFTMANELTSDPPAAGTDALAGFSQQRQFDQSHFYYLPRFGVIPAFGGFAPFADETPPIKVEKSMADLVEQLLVAEEAERLGLSVSPRELSTRLLEIDASAWFDPKTGAFDRPAWMRIIKQNLGSPANRFEDFVVREILREKVITLVTAGAAVSDAELAYYHGAQNNTADLEFVALDGPKVAALVPVDDAAAAAWLSANQDKVKAYYDANDAEFNKDERVVVRGILVKAPNRAIIAAEEDATKKAASVKERTEAKKRADALLVEVQAAFATPDPTPAPAAAEGEDEGEEAAPVAPPIVATPALTAEAFGAIAERSSDHSGSKAKGGLFDKPRTQKALGQWPFGPEVAAQVFGSKAGDVSTVIEVDSGYWIIRLESKLAAESKTFEAARVGIASALLGKEKAPAFAKTLADEVLAAAKASADKPLAEAIAGVDAKYATSGAPGITVATTGPFAKMVKGALASASQGAQVPRIGDSAALQNAALAAAAGTVLDTVFEVDGRFVVARVATREAAGDLDREAMAPIVEQLTQLKKYELYRGWYRALHAKALADGDVDFSSDWEGLVKAARELYVENGGTLPGAAAPAEGEGEAETRANATE